MFDLKIIVNAEQKMNGRYEYLIIHYNNNNLEWKRISDNDLAKYQHGKLGSIYYNDKYLSPLNASKEQVNNIKTLLITLIINANQDINYLLNDKDDDTSVRVSATLNSAAAQKLQKFISNYNKLNLVHSLKRTLTKKSL